MTIPNEVIEAFPIGYVQEIRPISIGLMHATFFIRTDQGKYIIQRMHPAIATDEIAQDFLRVTRFLHERDFLAPQCVVTRDGHVLVEDLEGNRWRAQTHLSGKTFVRASRPELAREAGKLFATFHKVMDGFTPAFRSKKILHDEESHTSICVNNPKSLLFVRVLFISKPKKEETAMRPMLSMMDGRIYSMDPLGQVERLLLTTPETRAICNNPFILGTEYTVTLRQAMTRLFANLGSKYFGTESNTSVLHILRGGLNFGLREALGTAFGWKRHSGAFVSSQRAYSKKGGWCVTEDGYKKINLTSATDWIIADVVATGVSLGHSLRKLVDMSRDANKPIRRITFITIGGARAEQIIAEVDARCREAFSDRYLGARVIYVEGIFGVPEEGHSLCIAIPGTDLLRHPAVLAPEFIASQNEAPSFPLERCTIYDAGSRAYDIQEYLKDVRGYWEKVLALADGGMSYVAYFRERFPDHPCLRLVEQCPQEWKMSEYLASVARRQIARAS